MESKDNAVMRGEKLKKGCKGRSVGKSWRHLQEHTRVAEISRPEMSKYNWSECEFDSYADLKRAIKEKTQTHNSKAKRALRSDASVACEFVFSFSPEMEKKIDIDNWYKANKVFIQKEFISKGATPIRLDLHMDEKTPHIHFLFIPTTKEGKISARDFMGGMSDLSKLQTRYAKEMEQFGLTRGYSRYSEYVSIRNRAKKAGYGEKYEDVKRYCEDYGLKMPDRKHHTDKFQYIKQLDEQIRELKKEAQAIKWKILNTTDKEVLNALKKQREDNLKRIRELEGFIDENPDLKSRWYKYRMTHLNEKGLEYSIEDDVLD